MRFEIDLAPVADLPTGLLVVASLWAWYVPVGMYLKRHLRRDPQSFGPDLEHQLVAFAVLWIFSPIWFLPWVFHRPAQAVLSVATLGVVPFPQIAKKD